MPSACSACFFGSHAACLANTLALSRFGQETVSLPASLSEPEAITCPLLHSPLLLLLLLLQGV
jgi:hypothetical protein